MEKEHRAESRKQIVEAFNKAEKRLKPKISDLFTDVYDQLPPHLKEQQEELRAHLAKYPNDYPVSLHAEENPENPHNKPKSYIWSWKK